MQTSDVIASIALVISILGVYLQSLSDRKQLMLSNFLDYTKRYQEIISHFPKEVIDEDFDLSSLSDDSRDNILRYMLMYFDLCYEEYSLYKLGFINLKLWELWESGIKSAFSRPAFKQSWQVVKPYTNHKDNSGFSSFVDSAMQVNFKKRKPSKL